MLRFIVLITLLVLCSAGAPSGKTHLPAVEKYGRLLGGSETTIDKVPWVAALHFKSYYICEGVIIKPNSILTVGQCTFGFSPPHDFALRVGSSHRSSGGQMVTPLNFTRHEYFTADIKEFDITVFLLKDNLNLGTNVAVVKLPTQDQTVDVGVMAVTAGWGAITEGTSAPEVIHKLEIPIVHQGFCRTSYGRNVSARMICAGITGMGLCSDKGAPLVVNDVLFGMASWSTGCGRPGLPSVYTRVAAFVDWIEKTLSEFP